MSAAALAVACAALAVAGYQLYWLRRLRAAVRELELIQAIQARMRHMSASAGDP